MAQKLPEDSATNYVLYDFYYSPKQQELAERMGYRPLFVNGKPYSECMIHPSESKWDDSILVCTTTLREAKITIMNRAGKLEHV